MSWRWRSVSSARIANFRREKGAPLIAVKRFELEIECHRDSFAEVLRKAIPTVEDVDFQRIEPKAIASTATTRKDVA